MIGLFLLGVYVGGALYALATTAFVVLHGADALNDELQRTLQDEHLRDRLMRQVIIAAVLWPIAVCYMATGRTPPW